MIVLVLAKQADSQTPSTVFFIYFHIISPDERLKFYDQWGIVFKINFEFAQI